MLYCLYIFLDGAATRPLPRPCWEWSSRQNAQVPLPSLLAFWISLRGPLRRCHCPVASRSRRPVLGTEALGTAMAQCCFGSPLKTIPRVWMSREKVPGILADQKNSRPSNLVPILAVEHVDIDLCIFTDHVMPQNVDIDLFKKSLWSPGMESLIPFFKYKPSQLCII